MAHVVCLLNVEAERATFTWSEGPASFEPYHLEGQSFLNFKETTSQLRTTLRDLVSDYLHNPGEVPKDSYALAKTGYDLYKQMFSPSADQRDKAKRVRTWLESLRRSIETLEIVIDGTWSMPWNLVYDRKPVQASFLSQEQGGRHWKPFWGVRYNLSGGKRVDPRYRKPLLKQPDVLMVIDPRIRQGLPREEQQRLNRFIESHESDVTVVTSKDELIDAIEEERPEIIYWMSHGDPAALELNGESVKAVELFKLLSQDEDDDFGGIAFLNACQSVETGDSGSFFQTFRDVGFSGVVGTEQQTLDTFANPVGIDFLESFLDGGEPIGKILHRLRRRVPLGLLYGAYCPPGIRVTREEEASLESVGEIIGMPDLKGVPLAMASAGVQAEQMPPLPAKPYRSLAYYGREDRALFAGRDADTQRFAKLLDEARTRLLILHGESGVGKSSFLRAGVVPYIEEACLGYRFLRRRDETDANEDRADTILFIRATSDLFGQLADALCCCCAEPYEYETPAGDSVRVDLPRVLERHTGAPPTPAAVRSALLSDTALLGRLLNDLGGRLPFTLLLIIDQGEEVFTLARTPRDAKTAREALAMLRNTTLGEGNFKVIFSLRTEYHGRLVDRLRRGPHDTGRIREYLLTDFDEEAIVQAIRRPTLRDRLDDAGEVPFEKYGFRYARGVPEQIARDTLTLATLRRDSVLPLVQVICTELYDVVRHRGDKRITHRDLQELGGIDGAVRNHVEKSLRRILDTAADVKPARRLFAGLYQRQSDGSLTTQLLPEEELRRQWKGRTPFGRLLVLSEESRLLRVNSFRQGGDEERAYVSLGHDSLCKLVAEWDQDLKRRERVRKNVLRAAGIAAIVLVIAGSALRYVAVTAESRRIAAESERIVAKNAEIKAVNYNAQLSVAFNALQNNRGEAKNLLTAVNDEELKDFTWRLFHQRSLFEPEVLPFDSGRPAAVNAVACSNRAVELLVTAGDDKVVRFWRRNKTTGKFERLKEFRDHTREIRTIAFDPQGRYVASGDEGGTIRLWRLGEAGSDAEISISASGDGWTAHDGAVTCVAFSPQDGQTLASAGYDRVIRLWNVNSRDEPKTLGGPADWHTHWVTCIAFSPAGDVLASAGRDTSIRLWDPETGNLLQTRTTGNGDVECLTIWDNEGSAPPRLASGSEDGTVNLWDVSASDTDRLLLRSSLSQGTAGVYALAVSPDGNTLASAGEAATVKLWDVHRENPEPRALGSFKTGEGTVYSINFLPGNGADQIAVGGSDGKIRVWDALADRQTRMLSGLPGPASFLAFGPGDGILIASEGMPTKRDLSYTARSADDPSNVALPASVWSELKNHDSVPSPVQMRIAAICSSRNPAFCRDVDTLVVVCRDEDRSIELWDWNDLATNRTGEHPRIPSGASVAAVAISPDRRFLAVALSDESGTVEDESANPRNTNADDAPAVGISARIVLWELPVQLNRGQPRRIGVLTGHTGPVTSLAMSALNGVWLLASGGEDSAVRLWNIETQEELVMLDDFEDWVLSVAFSPAEGSGHLTLATGDETANVMLWDVNELTTESSDAKAPLKKLIGHEGPVTSLCYSPDGKTLASASMDRTIRLWDPDPQTAQWRGTLTGHAAGIRAVTFSSDSRILASAGDDGTIRIWDAGEHEKMPSIGG